MDYNKCILWNTRVSIKDGVETVKNTVLYTQVRSSTKFVSYKALKAVCKDLKEVYSAINADAGHEALEAFSKKLKVIRLGQKQFLIRKIK